jgi:peptidoglycan/xylan/chitin deacetylase (PgdA/CDA1 family)
MRSTLVRVADRAMASGPVRVLSERLGGAPLRVLAYHGVEDPMTFQDQMGYLSDHYNPLSLADLVEVARGTGRLPDRAVMVTFDDGERSVLLDGLPILRQHGIPATVFVVTGALDGGAPFWWTEVATLVSAGATSPRLPSGGPHEAVRHLKMVADDQRLSILAELRTAVDVQPPSTTHVDEAELVALVQSGVAIGNHSMSHPCLNRCADEKVLFEIQTSHERLTDVLGTPPLAFAYPNGDWDGRVVAVLTELGYELGFLFDHRLSSVPYGRDLLVSRLRVDSGTTMERFAAILSGAHPALHRWRGRR